MADEPKKFTTTQKSAAAASILALIASISLMIKPNPKYLEWDQKADGIDSQGQVILPNQYVYEFQIDHTGDFFPLSFVECIDTEPVNDQFWLCKAPLNQIEEKVLNWPTTISLRTRTVFSQAYSGTGDIRLNKNLVVLGSK